MAVSLTVNGVVYSYPSVNDIGWGPQATAWATAVSQSTLQKTGGSFTLTAEVDFGATYGVKAAYLKSRSSNPAAAGILRLSNDDSIAWRNFANGADITLKVDTSNKLAFGSSAVSEAEFGYLAGVSSAIQTQLNAKEPTISAGTTAQYWRGDKSWQTLDKSAVGLGNVDNTSDATKNSAAATLENKTLLTPVIDDYLDINEESAPSTPASGKVRIYAKSDAKIYKKDDAGVETQLATTAEALSNPMTTVDDIIVGGVAGAATRKAKGSNNTVFGVDNSGNLGYTGTPQVTSISFGSTALANYEEGTWSASFSNVANLSGTASGGTLTYTRIGNTVFCRITAISGLTTTTANTVSSLTITPSSLPGLTNSTQYYGSFRADAGSTTITGSITDNSGANTTISLSWVAQASATATTLNSVFFMYII